MCVSDTVEPVHGNAQAAYICSMAVDLAGVDSHRWSDAHRGGTGFFRRANCEERKVRGDGPCQCQGRSLAVEFAQPQGGASIIIVRMDRHSSWLILSKRRQYLEVPIARDHQLAVSETIEGEVSRELVGDETLNGYPTELFEVTVAENGETRQYYQWVTKVQRFPVKTVSNRVSGRRNFAMSSSPRNLRSYSNSRDAWIGPIRPQRHNINDMNNARHGGHQ